MKKKKSIIMIGVTLALVVILSYQPPLAGFTQSKVQESKVEFKMDTTLLDSVIVYKLKIDSIQYESEYRLNTLKEQQRIISTFNKN